MRCLSSGDFEAALGYIARVRAVYPDAPVLGDWQRRLSSAEALAAAQAAEAERVAAAERERKAEAARQAEIERQRKAEEVARQVALERERKAAAEEAAQAAELERQRQAEAAQAAELERQRKAEEAARQALERERKAAAARQRKAGTGKKFSLPGGGLMEFVWVPAGRFRMGSPSGEEGRYSDEGPLHEVEISEGFWLGKYEVTQGEWSSVMGRNPSRYTGDSRRPVERVSWDDVQEFIAKLNAAGSSVYRLPSEAEWEYACRAGSGTRWSFGDAEGRLGDYAWYGGNNRPSGTKVVGRKRPNGWGLYDMHGNVWEWGSGLV